MKKAVSIGEITPARQLEAALPDVSRLGLSREAKSRYRSV
ncbi:hypothetical protein RISK_001518 [Rhodopirellula islandica]|uniref:Uncharacterized protein n=1 Tax=Rhodopirellula islandica TaxID=595434 RepID=A0A0J1BID7_RHOIS|nr:hypothetical protein RISK_001518 [Rhodopirellula islandica]